MSYYVGQGFSASAKFMPAAAIYGAGTVMATAQELDFVLRGGDAVPPGALLRILTSVMKIDVTAVPSGQTTYSAQFYSAALAAAIADQAVWALKEADLDSYRGSISLGSPVDLGDSLYVHTSYVDFDIKLSDTLSSLQMQLITDGGHTAAAVARQVFLYGVML